MHQYSEVVHRSSTTTGTSSDRPVRCLDGHEHVTVVAAGTTSPEVGGNSVAHVDGEGRRSWRRVLPRTSSASPPRDVAELHPGDLRRAHCETGQEHEDGEVSDPDRTGPVTTIQQILNLLGGHRLRDRRVTPPRHWRHRRRQQYRRETLDVEDAQ
jgi:hypothetical protein